MMPALIVPSVRPRYGIAGTLSGAINSTSQLVLRAYLIGGGFTTVSSGVTWSSNNTAVVSVGTTSGIVTFAGTGSCAVTATYLGQSYSTTATTQDEVTFLRANIVGGDAAMPGLYAPTNSGNTIVSGRTTVAQDMRGPGFGPNLTPPAGVGALTAGVGADTEWQGDATGGLQSALDAAFALHRPFTLASVVAQGEDPLVGLFSLGITSDTGAYTNVLAMDASPPTTGTYGIYAAPGGNQDSSPNTFRSSKPRLLVITYDGNVTATIQVYPGPATPIAVTSIPGATDILKLFQWFGQPSGARYRSIYVLNRVATAGDISTLVTAARTYHNARNDNKAAGDRFLLTVGDSITQGVGTTDKSRNWVSKLDMSAFYATWDVLNLGVNGVYLGSVLSPNINAQIPTIQALYSAARAKNVLTVWAATNNLAADSSAGQGAATLALLWAFTDARRAEGWKVVVGTMLARNVGGSQAAWNTERGAFNTGMRAQWAAHADALADVATGIYAPDASFSLFGDGIHPGDSDQAYITGVWDAAIQTV